MSPQVFKILPEQRDVKTPLEAHEVFVKNSLLQFLDLDIGGDGGIVGKTPGFFQLELVKIFDLIQGVASGRDEFPATPVPVKIVEVDAFDTPKYFK